VRSGDGLVPQQLPLRRLCLGLQPHLLRLSAAAAHTAGAAAAQPLLALLLIRRVVAL